MRDGFWATLLAAIPAKPEDGTGEDDGDCLAAFERRHRL